MDFIKELFKTMLGSFNFKKTDHHTKTHVEEKPVFSGPQLLGVPESSLENPIHTQKKKKKLFYIAIGVLVLSIIIALIGFFSVRNGYCNDIEKRVKEITLEYAEENALTPTFDGEYTIIDLMNVEAVKFNEQPCKGSVKITRVNGKFIQTINITDCNYCSTEKRYGNWTKETDKYNERIAVVDVIPYYNYYTLEKYNTSFSDWLASEEISKEKDKKYDVFLPLDPSKLPNINENAEIIKYEVENKNYYSYRDKQWKFYRYNINTYSGFSSTAPSGYPNKDTATEISTEPSPWSQNYPTEYNYRSILTKTAHRWYYTEDGNKIFWNNGEYLADSPGEKYIKDFKDSVRIYSYQDKMWRWYYGTQKRGYSSYTSVATSSYPYKDDEINRYTNWSSYKDVSNRNETNASYREERIDVYSRYRIHYNIVSLPQLDKYVLRDDLEKKLDKLIPDIFQDPSLKVDIKYKYRYK